MISCETFLDEYYLGNFSQDDYDFYIKEGIEEFTREGYIFLFRSAVDDRGVFRFGQEFGFVLLTPEDFSTQAKARWQLSFKTSARFREKLIRAAVFYFRTRQTKLPNLEEPQVKLLLKKARSIISGHSRKSRDALEKSLNFSASAFHQKAIVHSLQATGTRKGAPPSIHQRLSSLSPSYTPSHSCPLEQKVGILIQAVGSRSIFLSPLLLSKTSSGHFRSKQLTPRDLKEIPPQNLPEGLGPLLKAHAQLQEEQDWRTLKREQWSALYDRCLKDLFDEFESENLFFKEEKKKLPVLSVMADELKVEFQTDSRENMIRVLFKMLSETGLSAQFQLRVPFLKTESFFHFFFREEQRILNFKIPYSPDMERWIGFLCDGSLMPADAHQDLITTIHSLDLPRLYVDEKIKPLHRIQFTPIPSIRFLADRSSPTVLLDLNFDYDRPQMEFEENQRLEGITEVIPFRDFEESALNFFLNKGPEAMQSTTLTLRGARFSYESTRSAFLAWLDDLAQEFLSRGFEIFSIRNKKYLRSTSSSSLEFGVIRKRGWFRLNPKIKLRGKEGVEIEEADLEDGFLTDRNGDLHKINSQDLEKLREFLIHAGNTQELMIPEESFLLISRWYMFGSDPKPGFLKKSITLAKESAELLNQKRIPLPKLRAIELRPYQKIGFRWLHSLAKKGMHGCLADDMGLGKTLQTLCLLKHFQEEGSLKTSLVIAPLSVSTHWQQEAARYTPSLRTYLHLGPDRIRDGSDFMDYDLIITTYGTLVQDQSLFHSSPFQFLILDEAQLIKQSRTLRAKTVKKISSKHRIALSGTPVENRTMELWSLMDFLIPKYLGSRSWFQRTFATPIERGKVPELKESLRNLVSPFILRRKKEDVERELPEKIEIQVPIPMGTEQLSAYQRTSNFFQKRIRKQILSTGLSRSGPLVLEGLLRLRQICTLPSAANPEMGNIPSAKMDFLREKIPEILEEEHQVLIFSQFTSVLDEISAIFEELDIPFVSIRGSHSLKERKRAIESFQEEGGPSVFLISLKAGGTGLNLTAADYVIIMEPWWNPAVEAQAVDRAHRIGQKRPVIVYRLISAHTVEEKIQKIHAAKKSLFQELIEEGRSFLETANEEEILELFHDGELEKDTESPVKALEHS